MRKLAIAVTAAVVGATIAAGSTGAATPKTLTGVVGPGFTITLKLGTKSVSRLAAGKYTVVIHDKSNIHNFHLTGPGGVNKKTSVGGTGTTTWHLTLRAGSYRFVCDPHASFMKGSFTVK
ncbi:MAG TPA: plastocyanin/azurin family copper-binding protein [Gaiellaceae bacterium]